MKKSVFHHFSAIRTSALVKKKKNRFYFA